MVASKAVDASARQWQHPAVVASAVQLKEPPIVLKELLSQRHIRGHHAAPVEVRRQLSKWATCSKAGVLFDLRGRSTAKIQRELRSSLNQALTGGTTELAFAKKCGVSLKPRADDLEGMYEFMPGKDSINFGAAAVQSGLNVPLWMAYHARHCDKGCGPHTIEDRCYFKYMKHFMQTGFEPARKLGPSMMSKRKSAFAYIELWNEEYDKCIAAFGKWVTEATGLMSAPTEVQPEVVVPILPVVR